MVQSLRLNYAVHLHVRRRYLQKITPEKIGLLSILNQPMITKRA